MVSGVIGPAPQSKPKSYSFTHVVLWFTSQFAYNDERSATLSDKPNVGKEKVVSARICVETSCNQILAGFLLVKSPTKGLNVLKIPFREVTPSKSIHALLPRLVFEAEM
jgi:hypothetical protein